MSSLQQIKSLHFIGIGGAGMSALAELALQKNIQVSGSDQKDSEVIALLRSLGATISLQHQSSNILAPDFVVYSSAIKSDNPEMIEAREKGLTLLHRSELLCRFLESRKAIVVAGTHGKTTTTAMIYHLLRSCGLQPGFYLGGRLADSQKSCDWGTSEYFVIEGDESDGSFLNYKSFISVITNIDNDHLDFYNDINGIEIAFKKFLDNTHEDGHCVVGWDNALCREVSESVFARRTGFGMLLGSDVRPIQFHEKSGQIHYKIIVNKTMTEGILPMIGTYNLQNFMACLSVAEALQLNLAIACRGFSSFKGVERRLSIIADNANLTIVDDYAHNPGKISNVVGAVRKSWSDRKLIVVFQPHRYSRLQTMYNGFCEAFKGADHVVVMPIYSAGEISDAQFHPEQLAIDIASRSSVKASYCLDADKLSFHISKLLDRPALVLTVGAGDINEFAKDLAVSLLDH